MSLILQLFRNMGILTLTSVRVGEEEEVGKTQPEGCICSGMLN